MKLLYKQIWLWVGLMMGTQLLLAQTVDLTSLDASVSNLPTGVSISWHTSVPASSATLVPNPTAAPVGPTYYAVFFDAPNNCYAVDGAAVATVVNDCNVDVVVDLTTLVSGISNIPTGTTISWHTGPIPDASNQIATPTAVGISGIYYAAFFDAVNNCYSAGGSPVIVSVDPCCDLVAPAIIKN